MFSTNTLYTLTKTQYVEGYKKMFLLRKFEEKCATLYSRGLIGGFCHLYIGQEAIVVGFDLCRSLDDCFVTSYRSHAHTIISGVDITNVLGELLGRNIGCSKGKGGSMHMFNVKGHFYGGHGIVGAQVPIGTGIGFSLKYLSKKNVCYVFLGDGALNQGQVYEAFNMAALWKLPIIYIIENNEYSMGTSVTRSTALIDLYKKGQSFGIPGMQVNGMQMDTIFSILKNARSYVLDQGPLILEMKTYRYKGHSMSDPAQYRSRDEVDSFKKQDPLNYIRNILLNKKLLLEMDIKNIESEIKSSVMKCSEVVSKSGMPQDNELFTNVFFE